LISYSHQQVFNSHQLIEHLSDNPAPKVIEIKDIQTEDFATVK
jgi:hypothetical protein